MSPCQLTLTAFVTHFSGEIVPWSGITKDFQNFKRSKIFNFKLFAFLRNLSLEQFVSWLKTSRTAELQEQFWRNQSLSTKFCLKRDNLFFFLKFSKNCVKNSRHWRRSLKFSRFSFLMNFSKAFPDEIQARNSKPTEDFASSYKSLKGNLNLLKVFLSFQFIFQSLSYFLSKIYELKCFD